MGRINIAVLVSGGGTNLQAIIDAIEMGYIDGKISVVISNNEKAYGITRSKAHGINTAVFDRNKYPDKEERQSHILHLLTSNHIDLVVLAGYLDILGEEMIEKYHNRIMNVHPSLIPSFSGKGFYGEKVHAAAIERGVKLTGATVHFVNHITDGGPIILQEAIPVDIHDDIYTLREKVLKLEHRLLPLAIRLFAEDRLEVLDNKVKIHEEVKI